MICVMLYLCQGFPLVRGLFCHTRLSQAQVVQDVNLKYHLEAIIQFILTRNPRLFWQLGL